MFWLGLFLSVDLGVGLLVQLKILSSLSSSLWGFYLIDYLMLPFGDLKLMSNYNFVFNWNHHHF